MENILPKIALIGYGSMGKEVESIAKDKGFSITEIFEIDSPLNQEYSYNFDVAIDFSLPHAVLQNVKAIAVMKKNIVIGTTGWMDQFSEIKKIVDTAKIGMVYGSNFSLGVNLFYQIIEHAAKIMNTIDGYDIMVHELHHKRKKDSPSGTAKTIAEIILSEYKKKKYIVDNAVFDGPINQEGLHVSSTRGGEITGTHHVYIDSFADTIELTHRAKNRSGLAIGSLEAAKWIYGKSGLYEFKDILKNMLSS